MTGWAGNHPSGAPQSFRVGLQWGELSASLTPTPQADTLNVPGLAVTDTAPGSEWEEDLSEVTQHACPIAMGEPKLLASAVSMA